MEVAIRAETDAKVRRRVLETLTARLPEWFGQSESNEHYAVRAVHLPGWTASIEGREIGLLLLKRHYMIGAEIYWLGVDPDHHRDGIGRALVECVSAVVAAEKRKLLFALSLPPEDTNEHYRRTQRFYEGLEFVPVLTEHGQNLYPLVYYVRFLTGSPSHLPGSSVQKPVDQLQQAQGPNKCVWTSVLSTRQFTFATERFPGKPYEGAAAMYTEDGEILLSTVLGCERVGRALP